MRGDPEREVKTWLEKLSEADNLRAGYQEQAARGLMTLDELAARLKDLEEQHKTARRELVGARNRAGELEQLERDKEELLEHYEGISPEVLDNLTPEQRHRFYGFLRLKVRLPSEGPAELEFCGVSPEDFFVSHVETESHSILDALVDRGCRHGRTLGGDDHTFHLEEGPLEDHLALPLDHQALALLGDRDPETFYEYLAQNPICRIYFSTVRRIVPKSLDTECPFRGLWWGYSYFLSASSRNETSCLFSSGPPRTSASGPRAATSRTVQNTEGVLPSIIAPPSSRRSMLALSSGIIVLP